MHQCFSSYHTHINMTTFNEAALWKSRDVLYKPGFVVQEKIMQKFVIAARTFKQCIKKSSVSQLLPLLVRPSFWRHLHEPSEIQRVGCAIATDRWHTLTSVLIYAQTLKLNQKHKTKLAEFSNLLRVAIESLSWGVRVGKSSSISLGFPAAIFFSSSPNDTPQDFMGLQREMKKNCLQFIFLLFFIISVDFFLFFHILQALAPLCRALLTSSFVREN